MGLPLNKRDFDIFLSHAHADRVVVGALDHWLSEVAGFKVWFDGRELGGGSALAKDLQAAIDRSRAVVVVASPDAVKSGWVENEYGSAIDERANHRGFRVVVLRMPGADVSGLIKGLTWIDMPAEGLDAQTAQRLLQAFYPGEKRPDPATARDVYVSASWRESDSTSAATVCRALVGSGFRLIGDSKDQSGFSAGDRVKRIMSSCGAFVGIVPFRDQPEASASDGPYKYFMQEIDQAAELGLPHMVVADERVTRTDGSDAEWLRMDTQADVLPDAVTSAIERLWDEWINPPEPHYIFYATDLDAPGALHSGPIRHMVERVTGMPSVTGNEVREEPLHSGILASIQRAFLVLADITDDNINACIEAGMGLAAGRNVAILSRGGSRRPPFMLRSLQLHSYADELEQLGVVHKLVRPYRRRIINAEL